MGSSSLVSRDLRRRVVAREKSSMTTAREIRSTPTSLAFFCSNFERSANGCWEWTAADNGHYGVICIGYKKRRPLLVYAHRFSWFVSFGKIDQGKFVCHKCDNKKCVNPDHLFVGTQAENIADMDRKGRRVVSRLPGEKNPKAKLTSENVTEIRARFAHGVSVSELVRAYGVSRSTIWSIRKHKTWGDT
jgi:HNH endonuclease